MALFGRHSALCFHENYKLTVRGKGREKARKRGMVYQYNNRLQIKLIFATRSRTYIYQHVNTARMTMVRDIAVREARGGRATSIASNY